VKANERQRKGVGFCPTREGQSTSREHVLVRRDEAIEYVNL